MRKLGGANRRRRPRASQRIRCTHTQTHTHIHTRSHAFTADSEDGDAEKYSQAGLLYGRAPVSADVERNIFNDLAPLGYSQSVGCDEKDGDKRYLGPWCAQMQGLDMEAEFRPVRFGCSASDLLLDLPRIATRFNAVGGPNCNWATFAGSFCAAFFVDKPGGPQVVCDLPGLGRLHSKTPISHFVYEHRVWDTLILGPREMYMELRAWCTRNCVAFVCDEVLTFLTTDCPLPFSYLQVGPGSFPRPDFVLVGKYCGLAALLMCKDAALLLPAAAEGFYPVVDFLNHVRTDRTTFVDATALQRSTVLLQNLVSREWLGAGAAITRGLPGIFRAAGLPVPAQGGGFLWKYDEKQQDSLAGLDILSSIDCGWRVRFFLDTSLEVVAKLAKRWAGRHRTIAAVRHRCIAPTHTHPHIHTH